MRHTDRQRKCAPLAYQAHLPFSGNLESQELSDNLQIRRKKNLVPPDCEKINSGHRQWPCCSHIAQLEQEGNARVGVMPSSASAEGFTQAHVVDFSMHTATGNLPQYDTLRQSVLGREEDVRESGLALLKSRTLKWRESTIIGIHQSASFDRRKARLLEGPWIQWPVDILLLHHQDSDFLMR